MLSQRIEESDQRSPFVRAQLRKQADDFQQGTTRLSAVGVSPLPQVIVPRVVLIGLGLAAVQARLRASRVLGCRKSLLANTLRTWPWLFGTQRSLVQIQSPRLLLILGPSAKKSKGLVFGR